MKDFGNTATARYGGMTGTKMINATFFSYSKTKASEFLQTINFIANFANTK